MELNDPIRWILEYKGREVFSVAPTAPVFEAILRMSQARVGALLVLDKSHLVGIISERDYARKVILAGKSSNETLVREIMTPQVVTVGPTATVDECMQLMTTHRIRHLPVMDGQKVAGVVSIGDLVHWILSAQEVIVEQLTNYIAGNYPA
jgi:CBS domain-containing protein